MNQYAGKACRITVLAALTAATLLTAAASAGTVNLAQVPLISGLAKIVPPNLFLVLDDSSSTVNDYMPDGVGDMKSSRCFRNWGYNKLYYNPAITYSPPSKTGKTETQPTQQWTEAWKNGFNENDGKTDLSKTTTTTEAVPKEMGANPFSVTNGSTTVTVTQTSHGYTSGAQLVFTNLTNSSGKAITAVGSVPINAQPAVAITVLNSNQYQFTASKAATQTTTGGGQGPIATTFIQVNIASYYTEYKPNPQNPSAACESDADYINKVPSTSAEKTNFANWYSYYRTRELILKSTIGRAFATLDSNFRVGYAVLNNVTTNEGSNSRFRKIRPFTDNNKEPWYVSFYGGKADPSSGETPLRAGLARAGQMYAGVVNGLNGNNDPVQYSCQQNFTLLATDGYWTQAGESKNYGPYQMDGATAVGDQDSDTMKFRAPYLDGNKVANTLADVAAYYYNTDLRTSGQTGGPSGADGSGPKLDVSTNNVPPVNGDKASWQHMNTFALGLGVNGELVYSPDYLQGGSADYNAILAGSKNWPNPNPSNTDTQITARIDDLWHAAVNGHGQYFNATNPDTISASLKTMLAAISRHGYGSSAAATSNLEPIAGDNYAYVAQFTSVDWSGDLTARSMDLVTGALGSTPVWSAAPLLAQQVTDSADTRTIYTFSAGGTNKLKAFTAANLATEINSGYFRAGPSNPNTAGKLTQYNTLTGTAKDNLDNSTNMISWIRGQNGYEMLDSNPVEKRVYRARTSVMADIVNSAPVYVKQPPFSYLDTGYGAYAAAQKNRQAMVYVGANDGMLHAFNATTGNEVWAYIPSLAVPNLYLLADSNYANNHKTLLDGPITVGDVYDSSSSSWKTILVGMMGSGGKGVFALDITNPAVPKALWEFTSNTDSDLGFTLGNAVITKRNADGKWVVVFASGYNNGPTNAANDARLFVVDALTGTKYSGNVGEIVATEYTTDYDQTGLARITAYVESSRTNNTTRYIYGGNLAGTIFRFDIDSGVAQMIGHTSTVAGDLPITTRPEVATVRTDTTSYRVVYVGTGRFLGMTDTDSSSTSFTKQQAIFAFKDTGTDLQSLQSAGAGLVQQTLDNTTVPSTIPNPQTVNWDTKNGWYVKLPLKERINVDLKLQLGTVVAVSNKPTSDYCYTGGSSTQYVLGYKDGAAISTQASKVVGTPVGSALATGIAVVKLPTGKVISLITEADTTVATSGTPVNAGSGTTLRRVSWKELL